MELVEVMTERLKNSKSSKWAGRLESREDSRLQPQVEGRLSRDCSDPQGWGRRSASCSSLGFNYQDDPQPPNTHAYTMEDINLLYSKPTSANVNLMQKHSRSILNSV